MKKINIIEFKKKNSVIDASNYLFNYFSKTKKNNVVLTGGNSVQPIYKILFKKIKSKNIKMNIFLSDERVVSLNSKNLNANLFIKLADHKIKLNSMIKKRKKLNDSIYDYEKKLPAFPKIILLTVGQDGHIASIFKDTLATTSKKKIIYNNKVHNSFKRITITLNYLKNKKNLFLLCTNKRLKIFNDLIKKRGSVLNLLFKINPKFKLLLIKN